MSDKNERTIRSALAQHEANEFGAGILIAQVLIISCLAGLLRLSWWWFAGTLVVLTVAAMSKKFGKALAVILAVGWGAFGFAVGKFFDSNGMSIVLGVLMFAFALGANVCGQQFMRDADAKESKKAA